MQPRRRRSRFQAKGTGESAWIDAVETIADTAGDRPPARSIQPIAGGQDGTVERLFRGNDGSPADVLRAVRNALV